MDNYHVVELVGEGSFGKVSNVDDTLSSALKANGRQARGMMMAWRRNFGCKSISDLGKGKAWEHAGVRDSKGLSPQRGFM